MVSLSVVLCLIFLVVRTANSVVLAHHDSDNALADVSNQIRDHAADVERGTRRLRRYVKDGIDLPSLRELKGSSKKSKAPKSKKSNSPKGRKSKSSKSPRHAPVRRGGNRNNRAHVHKKKASPANHRKKFQVRVVAEISYSLGFVSDRSS